MEKSVICQKTSIAFLVPREKQRLNDEVGMLSIVRTIADGSSQEWKPLSIMATDRIRFITHRRHGTIQNASRHVALLHYNIIIIIDIGSTGIRFGVS
jgi:hypothetical protein